MQQSLNGLSRDTISLQQLIISSDHEVNSLRSALGREAESLVTLLSDPALSVQFNNTSIGLDAAFCLGLSREQLQDFTNQDLIRLLVLDSSVFPAATRPFTAYSFLEALPSTGSLPTSVRNKVSDLIATRLTTLVEHEDSWHRASTADISEIHTILGILAIREDLRGTPALRAPEALKAIQTVLWPSFAQRNRLNLDEQTNQTIRIFYPRNTERHTGISAVLYHTKESRTYPGVLRFSEVQISLRDCDRLCDHDLANIALMMLAQRFFDGVINRDVSGAVNELLYSREEAVPSVIRGLSRDLGIDPTCQSTDLERVEYELPRLYHSARILVETSRDLVDQGHTESSYLKQVVPELIIHLVKSLDSNVFRSAKADLFAAISELPGEWLTQKQLFILGQKLFRDSGAGITLAGRLAVQKFFGGGSSSNDKT